MKAAIVYADKITTVSPTYSNEILTEAYGERMDGVLRYRREDLWGIVNGIDTKDWNPKTDARLAKNYDVRSYVSGKKANKKALQEELGLEVREDVPMIGIVSRLTKQKGVYMITERLREIMGMDIQFCILGTGETDAENAFKWMESEYKGKGVYYCGYNEDLAHRIYAGCDIFLMPSIYEPCGIGQLIAMRYGALPLVRETGGLKDTVAPFRRDMNSGNGFTFDKYDASLLLDAVNNAKTVYFTERWAWDEMVKRDALKDVSWDSSAAKYLALYDELIKG
jgi:starch synthase